MLGHMQKHSMTKEGCKQIECYRFVRVTHKHACTQTTQKASHTHTRACDTKHNAQKAQRKQVEDYKSIRVMSKPHTLVRAHTTRFADFKW